MRKGIISSIDSILAIMIIFLIVYLMFIYFNFIVQKNIEVFKEFELKEKTIFLIDSIIKNPFSNSEEIGASFFDSNLKRNKPNVVDEKALKKLSETVLNEKVKKLFFKTSSKKTFFIDKKSIGNCFSIGRSIFLKKGFSLEKGVLVITVCDD
jgi:hypothetical protein